MRKKYLILILMVLISSFAMSQMNSKESYQLIPFGEGGAKKMTYDRRQHPQALLMGDEIHLVYNGGAPAGAQKMTKTLPFVTSYNIKTGEFSESIELPGEASKDHHFGPVIWADKNDFIHVLSGCHKTPGTHVVSTTKNKMEDWKLAPQVASSLSYPSVSQIHNNKQLIYYRTAGHRSFWTYSISSDNGNSWVTPENPVVDLNNGDELSGKDHKDMDEASSYHTYLASDDGRYVHIAFMYYDDNKKNIPEKSFNPLYQKDVGTLKTNLYYVKVNLENHEVTNFDGKKLSTPIKLKDANKHCKIWDTNWRGAGVPPDIIIDENDNPAFLHVLTEKQFEKLNYYYVRRVGDEWKQTIIAPACHKWNSSHLTIDDEGVLHAYLLMDDGYFESNGKGVMNSHGGGTRIEEWISKNNGDIWEKENTLLKAEGKYDGWRFNNIQPIKNKDGNKCDGMFLFYGWAQAKGNVPHGKAFLLIKN